MEFPIRKDISEDLALDLRGFVEQQLGNMPLAVSLLKKVLRGKEMEEARELFGRLRSDVQLLPQPQSDWYIRSLGGMVADLMQRLEDLCRDDQELLGEARRLLAMLAALDPARVGGEPDELFLAIAAEEGGRRRAFFDPDLFGRAVEKLALVGLVERPREGAAAAAAATSSSMHQLLQSLVRTFLLAEKWRGGTKEA